jgi:hypothetical protein
MKAWELIEQRGWCQGHGGTDKLGRICAAVAINMAHQLDASEARARLLKFIDCGYITKWNDDPARTKAQVIAKMKEADV